MDNWAQVFLSRLTELRSQHADHLVSGSVDTFEEYRHLCGVLKGLDMAERELKELLSEVED
tara:strand:- start:3132 stop:3314 length:183 start_codon:yes stop_codon:yes gene_type:complete